MGGGVTGLSTAYQLALRGVEDVVVLEKSYILAGASGRNGGGVRAQWTNPGNVVLARESIRMFEDLSRDLGFNVWFRQGGYLFLAFREDHLDDLAASVRFQNRFDVPSRLVDPDEAQVLAPDLHAPDLVGASYCPIDGIVFPWAVVQGYLKQLKRTDVEVRTFTPATDLVVEDGRVVEVRTPDETYRPEWVVDCAGCWSPEVAAMAGVELPNHPQRHEILVTEAVKPFLDPMIVDLETGLYANQDMRGECVAGMGDPQQPPGIDFSSSYRFLRLLARRLTTLLPRMGNLQVLRQWAGMYDVTPDHRPILGPSPGVPNLLQANGFSGHGFMISPMVGVVTAKLILGEEPPVDLEPFLLDRYLGDETPQPEGLVIG